MKRLLLLTAVLGMAAIAMEAYAEPENHPHFITRGEFNAHIDEASNYVHYQDLDSFVTYQGLDQALDDIQLTPGPAGADGADGADGGSYEAYFDDSRLNGAVAGLAAAMNIPDVHGADTGIGIGFGQYGGYEGIALGIVHRVDALTIKATVSTSSNNESVYGIGATFGF